MPPWHNLDARIVGVWHSELLNAMPTKAKLTIRIAELEAAVEGLAEIAARLEPRANAGMRLAALWLRDCPLEHRVGCQCHFCLLALEVKRMGEGR